MICNLFISHSWNYPSAYAGLVDLLDKAPGFPYKNYLVPKSNPIHHAGSKAQLKAAIRNQMRCASCILILAGAYSTYSKWIRTEVELAQEMGKRIIAVEPWAVQHTYTFVKDTADVIVDWNTNSIIRSVRGY